MGKRRVKLFKVWLLWLPLLAASTHAFSQNSYPVHVTVQVLPPYGLYLSDYYSGTRDRLVITLLNRDVGQNTLQVKLRLTIKNGSSFSLRSRDELYYPMITLPSGIPLRLTNSDIVPYLTPDRISINGYLQNGKLPVGMTEFSVQAFDYVTGLPLSFVATGRAWLELKQPPILNLPQKDEYVEARTPQYIRFQWMPRHQGVAATVYQFTLRELPDNGAAPQSAFLYGNPVYQTETRFTTINYTHLEPLLSPGKRYGWQVRAVAMDGVDEIGLFDNNGLSEVGWFQLSDNTPAPLNVTAQAGYRKMTIDWQLLPDYNTYVVQYRPKSERDLYDWTSTQTLSNTLTAYDLTAGWTYEYRVGTLGLSQNPVFSPVGEVTLPMDDEARLARCGMVPQVDLSNQNPNESLAPGQVVIIGGDFPMTVTELFSQGSGWYSGKGYITMPWVFEVKVLVQFDRLRVNTDNRQIGGAVETQYDPTVSQIANLNELDQGNTRTTAAGIVYRETVKLDFTVPPIPDAEYNPETGVLIIYDEAGTPHRIDIPKNEGKSAFPFIVEDDQDNKYQVDLPEDGKVLISGAEDVIASEYPGMYTVMDSVRVAAAEQKVKDLVVVLQLRIRAHLKNAREKYPKLAYENERILPENTIFDPKCGAGAQYRNGKIYIGKKNFVEKTDDEDILGTVYHEFMHYLNWIFGDRYRMSDLERGIVYNIYLSCFENRLQEEDEFLKDTYDKFYADMINSPNGSGMSYLVYPQEYKELDSVQRQKFDNYIEEKKLKRKITCIPFRYSPSNYFKDEINAHEETLKAHDKEVFKMSDEKISEYHKEIEKYTKLYYKAVIYETNNNMNSEGYEK